MNIPVYYDGQRMNLPVSDSIRMRPVWRRRQLRVYMQNPLPPPSDDEKHDAIQVLADSDNQRLAPALYQEAERILHEA